MDTPDPTRGLEASPQDSADAERHVAALTGMTLDSARTFMEFHSGMRWLRRDRDRD
jgi:hypothetical protein